MDAGSCPVDAFRFNASAAAQWVNHEWSNAQLEGEDIGTLCVGLGLLLASALVLLKGEALVKPVFFLTGAVCVLVPAFAAVSAILDGAGLSAGLDCTLLIVLPLGFAVVAGLLNVWFLHLAFVMLGLVGGGTFGYCMYVLVLHTIPSPVLANGYTLVFCAAVLCCALAGALCSYKLQHGVLMAATAVLGAVGVTVALDLVVLGRVDRRFLWLLDARSASEHLSSAFVFGPIVGAAVLAVSGFLFQRDQKMRRRLRAYQMPLIQE